MLVWIGQVFSLKGGIVLSYYPRPASSPTPGEYKEEGIKIAHKGVTLITHKSE